MVELIQRKRGKKRCMLFRSPEKTQRIRVKLFLPTAQLPSLLGMATLGLLWSKGMLWKPRLTAGQTVAAHLHITAATSHSQSVRLFIFQCLSCSKSGFRYARANKTKQVSSELPCQLLHDDLSMVISQNLWLGRYDFGSYDLNKA